MNMEKKISDAFKKVLFILPSAQDIEEMSQLTTDKIGIEFLDDEAWNSYEPSLDSFDPNFFIEKCVNFSIKNNICAIMYSDDLANFLASVICDKLSLPGPTKKSMFLSNHKFYSRTEEVNPITFNGFELCGNDWEEIDTFPLQVKPVSLFFSLLQSTVYNKQQLRDVVQDLRLSIPKWERPFVDVFSRHMDSKRYPFANKYIFMAEEFVNNAVSQHAVEGWSDENGNHNIWAVSDNNYFGGSGSALDNNSIPSRLPKEIENKIIQVTLETISKFDFKNGFWNVELWIRSDNQIHVTEVNGRICASMTPLYKHVYGSTQYGVMLELALGGKAERKKISGLADKKVGGMFAISTTKKGLIRNLLDLNEFEKISSEEGVIKTKLMFAEDTNIEWHQSGNRCCIARAWVVGSNFDEINNKAAEIRKRVLV